MVTDNPDKPEFASWRSYEEFARRVRHNRRYVWSAEVRAFLETVRATLRRRDVNISQGTIFYRAQLGIEYDPVIQDGVEVGEELHGFAAARMKPLPNRAREGRVNPAGIPALYLATSEQTAISEVRPWIGSELSVAQFRVVQDLRAIDLSRGHGQMSIGHLTFAHLLGDKAPNAETKEKAVWIEIDNAFSRPITASDDSADYVPTQILAEFFADMGYEAVIYRSQFGTKGYNIAIFNVDHADAINCAPYRVKGLDVAFEEIGNRWFSTRHAGAPRGKPNLKA